MCVQKKSSGRRGMQKPPPSPVQTAADKMTGRGEERASLPEGVALREVEKARPKRGREGPGCPSGRCGSAGATGVRAC